MRYFVLLGVALMIAGCQSSQERIGAGVKATVEAQAVSATVEALEAEKRLDPVACEYATQMMGWISDVTQTLTLGYDSWLDPTKLKALHADLDGLYQESVATIAPPGASSAHQGVLIAMASALHALTGQGVEYQKRADVAITKVNAAFADVEAFAELSGCR